jgi:hypothetical protein
MPFLMLGEPSLELTGFARTCSLRQSDGYDYGREHAQNPSFLRDLLANSCNMRANLC